MNDKVTTLNSVASEADLVVDANADVRVGIVGLWKKDNETRVGVVLDIDKLQLYKSARYGMVPFGLPDDIQHWTLVESIEDYGYEQRGNSLYLLF